MSDSSDPEHETGVTDSEAGESPHGIHVRDLVVAGIGGFLGEIAMVPFFAIAYLLGVLSPAAFVELAALVGVDPGSPMALLLGLLLFVVVGVTVLTTLYVSLSGYLPPEHDVGLRGVPFALVVWTGFLVAFWTGQRGLDLALYVVLTFLAHAAYGYVLGRVYDYYSSPVDYEV